MPTAVDPRPLPDKALIAMIHVGALPGTPQAARDVAGLAEQAAAEAALLAAAGFDALLIENMHDRPYLRRRVGPEITAAMTAVGCAVRAATTLPVGVQILAGANRAALAVAAACGAAFIRAESFVFAHVADEGLMDRADAGPLLRYRRAISAGHIAIWADIKKKHSSHAITADVDLPATARAAEFFGADGLVVTGQVTGDAADPADVRCVHAAVDIPVVIGSGLTADNLGTYWPIAQAFIVGSSLKRDGLWSNPPDSARCREFVAAAQRLRRG